VTIEIRDLAIVYNTLSGGQLVALDELAFEVADGEFVAIVGPSGCGKSTILKTLCGLVTPTRGAVNVGGVPVRNPRADISVVFQEARLLPWLNVLDNVLIPIRVQGRPEKDYLDRAQRLLATARLNDFAQSYPNELSGGMQQRVAICRALVHDPSTLLMDEPFGALDALTREVMSFELLRLWEASRKTVLFVTHSIAEAVLLADRVIVMTARPGRIHEIVPVELERPRRFATMATPAFGALAGRIREMLNATGDVH
jgi:NitT/TauT family transport system ATP-binding protein